MHPLSGAYVCKERCGGPPCYCEGDLHKNILCLVSAFCFLKVGYNILPSAAKVLRILALAIVCKVGLGTAVHVTLAIVLQMLVCK